MGFQPHTFLLARKDWAFPHPRDRCPQHKILICIGALATSGDNRIHIWDAKAHQSGQMHRNHQKRQNISVQAQMADGMITKNLSRRNTDANSSFGIAKLAIAVSATTITTIVLTMPASTADCPTINPPTIPIVLPSGPGRRIPASRKAQTKTPSGLLPRPQEMSPCSALMRLHTEASSGEYHYDTR